MAELLFKDLTEKIIKVFLEVYNHLGFGYTKNIYLEALTLEMTTQGLAFEKAKEADIFYKETKVGQYVLDFVCDDKVIIHIDTCDKITDEIEYSIVNHLKSTRYEVGLVLNFGRRPEVKRKIFQNQRKSFIPKGENTE